MLPKSHPSLVNLEKKEGQFYLIEGLENIPIEPAPSHSTGENNPNNFNRWVELSDKITIAPYEVADKSTKNSDSNNKDIQVYISTIQKFFQQYNVESIEINSSNDLLVKYNGSSEVIKNDDERGTGIIKDNLKRVLLKDKLNKQELENL